jgi:hypothetical protein
VAPVPIAYFFGQHSNIFQKTSTGAVPGRIRVGGKEEPRSPLVAIS